MKFPPETLMAYTDGELDAQTRQAIEAAMATDQEVAEQVARHRALRSELTAAFGGVLHEPIPDRLLEAAQSSATASERKIVSLSEVRAEKAQAAPRRRWSWPEWTAVAASLLIGVIVGRVVTESSDANLIATEDSHLVAAGALAATLSQQLGGSLANDAAIAVGLSFRSKAGDYCRTFSAQQDSTLAGLACRESGQWRVHALAQPDAGTPDGDFRTAGSRLPPAIIEAVERTIDGDLLDKQEEEAARDRDWKR